MTLITKIKKLFQKFPYRVVKKIKPEPDYGHNAVRKTPPLYPGGPPGMEFYYDPNRTYKKKTNVK